MKPSVKDYLIIEVAGKYKLGRCISVEPLRAIIEEEIQEGRDKPLPIEFSKRDLAANLGTNPTYGTAWGVKVEVLHRRFSHDWFGSIHLYRGYPDEVIKDLKTSLQKTSKWIQGKRLPQLPLTLEIRNPQGKYAGHYKYRKGQETDIMVLRLGDDDINPENMHYVTTHEYAHGIWSRYVSQREQTKWIKIYHDAMTVVVVEKRDLKSLHDDLIAEQSIGSFFKAVEDEDKMILKGVIKHIKATHGLDRHHLQLIISMGDDLLAYWPTYLEVGESELLITDYAKKSPEELFAETFAFWAGGKKLPKKLGGAIDETLRRLKKVDVTEDAE